MFVFPTPHSPTGLIMQTPLIREWIFLGNSQTKSVTPYLDVIATIILKGRECVQQLTGQDPCLICTTLTSKELKHSLQNSLSWQLALADYVGQIDNHYPDLLILQFLKQTRWILPRITSVNPVPSTPLIFTDGTSRGKAGYTCTFMLVIETPEYSAQQAEILAVMHPLQNIPLAVNMEKAMAPHSSTVAWKIPWVEEPGRLQSHGVAKSWT